MAASTRQRMVKGAAALVQIGGLAMTSSTEVLAASGAARGRSTIIFPGAKAEPEAAAALIAAMLAEDGRS